MTHAVEAAQQPAPASVCARNLAHETSVGHDDTAIEISSGPAEHVEHSTCQLFTRSETTGGDPVLSMFCQPGCYSFHPLEEQTSTE